MIWVKRIYFRSQIKLFLFFKPTALFDRINKLDWYQNTLRQWLCDQKLTAHSQLLEVGCASGALTSYIADSGCSPTGVDFSEEMIELAKVNNGNIDFFVADVLHLPFKTGSFDLVIAASLINIVKDKETAMRELARACKTGGTVSILVPVAGFNSHHLDALQVSLENSGFSHAAMNAWHTLPPKMKVGDISKLFKQVGLTEITTKYYLQGMVISVTAIKPRIN